MPARPIEIVRVPRPSAAVLVVNDRHDQRVAIRATLASLDVAVVEAESGHAALRAVLRQTFALILMDVRMPGMDGYETADLIRQRCESSRTPIIFLTAYGREDDRQSLVAYASGAIDFIYTPVVPDVLRAKVSAFVNLFLQSEELQRSLDSIKTLNVALRDLRAGTQAVLDNVADGIVAVSEGGMIESLNPSARALFGYREEEVTGQPLTLLIAPARRAEFHSSSNGTPGLLTVAGAQNRAVETLGLRHDGSTFAMEVEHGEMKRGDQSLTLAFVRDISARNAYDMVEHQARHDGLTGVANRTLFEEHVVQALASAKRNDESRAVLVMDLDGFKQVNDTLGHDRGDAVLKQVVTRLAGVLRETDTIARLGGDEFAILPAGATDLTSAAAVAWTIQQACAADFKVNDAVVHVSASIGIALFPEHGTTTDELLRRADAAMYVAKRSGIGHAVFDAAHETQAADQLALLADLRQCVVREELVLHYQPKIDLATGEISGVEALIRWQHPTQGLLAPASFLADVERTALIEPVTRWVLNEALRQQRSWRDDGVDLTVAVNISAHSLRPDSHLPDIVAELTETWGTTPERLTLELSEGALREAPAPDILDRLHSMGAKISIDAFGTGSSSLADLPRLPVDEIKIHTSFITSLAADSDSAIIVRAMIDLAHNLGLRVVAEGVEEQTAMDLLVAYGCDSVQGRLLARPSANEQLSIWLTESPYGPQVTANR
jgi:diguanylate cyclase (GGDEF)-like protein/PAS domain S-box-containing protein